MTLLRFDPFRDRERVSDVSVERNVVTVRATRRPARGRQLFLGDNLDTSRLSADFERGVLTLRIPVAESSKPRRVEIGSRDERRQVADAPARARADAHTTA
ncbi:Hsp20/alpha crystallin family protein [Amycolatopsis kentuckyensis]|uniref:Hsp20/alpha crystallin family protein n=1 Tax=Amycolatopsis kentuckyensis TaxID=218823 RepID=UPI00356A8086